MKSTGNINSDFQESIINGNFEMACKFMNNLENIEIQNQLISISIEDQSLMSYEFLTYVISKNEKADYHAILANLMISAYNVLPGAYEIALMHTKKALELDEKCIEAWAMIMYLGMHPDSRLTRKDMEIAKEKIKEIDPNNQYLKENFWD